MFFLDRLKQDFSRGEAGREPNASFAAEHDRLSGHAPARLIVNSSSP